MKTSVNYSNDNIVFSDDDTLQQTLIKIVHLNAGNHTLKKELAKHKVSYVKVCKGAKTTFVLRSPKIAGKLIVKL